MSSTVDVAASSVHSDLGRAAAPLRKRKRNFYSTMTMTMTIALSIVVLLGFGPTFYFRAYTAPALHLPPLASVLVWVHGFVFTSWMLLLFLQTTLVRIGKVHWHQKVGIAGAILGASMVLLGTVAQVAQTQRLVAAKFIPLGVVNENLVTFGALIAMVIFAGLIGAAVRMRRRPETHKRLILLATMILLGAATGRIGGIAGFVMPALGPYVPAINAALVDVFIVALAVHDLRATGRLHRATVWGAIPILLLQSVSFTSFYASASATAFTTWLGNL